MKVLTILGVILACVLLLGFLRVGIVLHMEKDRQYLVLRIGPLLLRLPEKRGEKKPKKPKEEPEEPKKKRSLKSILELVRFLADLLLRTVKQYCCRLRLDPLDVTVVFGMGEDPYEAAMFYNAANTAVWTVMPKLEELFDIPDPAVRLRLNETGREALTAEGRLGASVRINDLVAIVFFVALGLIRWWMSRKTADKSNDKTEQAA